MTNPQLFIGMFCFVIALNCAQASDSPNTLIDKQLWQTSAAVSSSQPLSKAINSQAKSSLYFDVDIDLLERQLLTNDSVIIDLPLPNGEYVRYRLTPSKVMHPALALKYPAIRTFSGVQLDKPENQGKFDITPQGFHGVFNHGNETIFIDPSSRASNRHYHNYYRKDAQPLADIELTKRWSPRKRATTSGSTTGNKLSTSSNATQLVTYKLAIATTGEYSEFHGGTKELVLAALVTLVNRLNDVYQRDLAMQFELVAENDSIIFLDSDTDPFANTDEDIDLNVEVINAGIGFNNYDIGHLVGTGGGGLASFEAVCKSFKAEGVTGSSRPTSDTFYIDYVAHEIGHQFGADHTFNGTQEACAGNRVSGSAYEPGSASTVMGYAGICAGQNLQNNSDPYFHIHSIDQIRAFTAPLVNCGLQATQSNDAPIVNAGADYTIPARTPFTLVGSATDPDGDNLTYSWQQFDLGAASSNAAQDAIDDGQRPLFRTFSPISSAERTLPQLGDILANRSSYGEALPSLTRALNFRLVVRDNQNNLVDDAIKVNVIAVEDGFSVNDIASWNGFSQTVTWHTADTENPPVACAAVDILLSTDSGASFSQVLASNVSNDGSHDITLANLTTDKARIKIACSDNIFFAINNADFDITSTDAPPTKPVFVSQNSVVTDEDIAITLTTAMLAFENNPTIESLQLLNGENYDFSQLSVTPLSNFNGELMVNVTATANGLVSDVFQVKIAVTAVNDSPVAVVDSTSVEQDSAAITLDVLINDSDIDGDVLTVQSAVSAGSGDVQINDNKIVYTPASGFNGTEIITYTIVDAAQATASAEVTIIVTATPVTPAPVEPTPVTPAPVEPTPTAPPTVEPDSSSSGGSVFYLLIVMILSGTRQFMRGQSHA